MVLRQLHSSFDFHDTRWPCARVTHDANQLIAHNTLTALAFNTERFDTDVIHDNVTNNSRLTCKTAGKYLIIGQVRFDTNNAGLRYIDIKLNGTTIIAVSQWDTAQDGRTQAIVATIYDLAATNYVELEVFQTSGGNLNVELAANWSPEFMMVLVG